MALKVYTSGNYIITDTGTVMHEFAKGYTTYSYNQTSQIFTIRESVGGSFTVTRAQLLAGDITDESSVAYTFNSFVTFLRENTGFKTASGGSEAYSTTVVNISSAQILSMGTTPIELLPVLPALSYYDIESILLEYTFISTNYTLTEPLYAAFGFGEYFTISERIINGNASVLKARVAGVVDQDLVAAGTGAFINMDIDANVNGDTSLTLTTWNSTNPTLGNGTLRAIITYTTRTFGS